MKRLFLYIMLIICELSFAQDIIVTKDNQRIDAKIIEVSETTIKYKKTTNLDGPTFSIQTDKISSVVYQNGNVQTFLTSNQNNSTPSLRDIAYIQQLEEKKKETHTPVEGPWLVYGVNVKEGINLYFESGTSTSRDLLGLNYLPSIEGYVEYAWKQEDMPTKRNAVYLGLQYSFRGGKIGNGVTNSPVSLNLQYLCFRPAFSHEGKIWYIRPGIELGVLTYAGYKDRSMSNSVNVRNGCNKATFGIWTDMGWTIKKHFTIGFAYTYVITNSTKDLWTVNAYSPHISVQASFGWRFDPYKFDKKKIEKIEFE